MNGIAYLSVGTEQRRDANFTTEIGLRSTVFAPVETARDYGFEDGNIIETGVRNAGA